LHIQSLSQPFSYRTFTFISRFHFTVLIILSSPAKGHHRLCFFC
jgi:hypothetical protein